MKNNIIYAIIIIALGGIYWETREFTHVITGIDAVMTPLGTQDTRNDLLRSIDEHLAAIHEEQTEYLFKMWEAANVDR